MKNRPFSLLLLSIIFAGISVSFPLQIMYLYEIEIWQLKSIFNKLTSLNLSIMALCLVSSFLAYQGKKQLIFISPLITILVIWNNLLVGWYDAYYSLNESIFSSLAMITMQTIFLFPGCRYVMSNQSKRWWMQKERRKMNIPIKLIADQTPMDAITYDISESGAFVQIDRETVAKNLISLPYLTLNFSGLAIKAAVVRINEAKGHYPEGVGVRFLRLTPFQTKSLKVICHS